MKKVLKLCLALLIVGSTFLHFDRIDIKADDGYYYNNIDITVNVNDAREYEITEVLSVHFDEESHGIIRSIPLYSQVESYSITNISVEGDKYVLEPSSTEMRIKIGDAAVWVKGDKTYTIKYTLVHFQDYDEDADFIYLNLIGSSFDTSIKNFKAKITYPVDAVWEKTTVTSGYSSSTENRYVDYQQNKNVITMQSKDSIPSYTPVTLQVQLAQGTFLNAPVYQYPFFIKNLVAEIDITIEKEYKIKMHYEMYNDTTVSQVYLVPIDVGDYGYSQYAKVDDFVSSNNDYCYLSSSYIFIRMPAEGEYSCDFSYTLRPYTIKKSSNVHWEFFQAHNDTKLEKYNIKISTPFDFPANEWEFGRYGDTKNKDSFADITLENNTLTIVGKRTLQSGEKIQTKIYFDNSMFTRPIPISYPLSIVVCLLFAGAYIIITITRFGKKSIVQTVEFYPPYGINTIEAGYLIDSKIQDTDISSIIFYWASKGYIRILNTSKNNYTFYRLMEPDNSASQYEVELFSSMFELGDGEAVTTKELKGLFYIYTSRAEKAVIKTYNEPPNDIWDRSTKTFRMIGQLLALAPLIISIFVLSHIFGNSNQMFSILLTIFSPTVGMVVVVLLIIKTTSKYSLNTITIALVVFILLPIVFAIFVLAVPYFSTEHFITLGAGILATIICLVCTTKFKKHSEFGNDILGKLYGFKEFIVTAEKDRLEMLLEQDPEYYYHILPYAQVLKVTKIWEKKFKDITMEPPTWYDSPLAYSHATFMSDFVNAANTVTRASLPPASSGGSGGGSGGFSGGGGGFSGGGSSGGGSGGGGSSRW